jgi:hypothetical protein
MYLMNLYRFSILFAVFFLSTSLGVMGQSSIPVKIGSLTLSNAWAGGLNFCQISEIDLDGDGIKDLFVFDRTGNKVRTFLNKGATGYSYDRAYEGIFPVLRDWVLLRDYNCDGLPDIFTYSEKGGIAVYKNIGTPGNHSFSLFTDLLFSNYTAGAAYNLYISPVDIPSITDVDGDGDLDILTFNAFGSSIEFHKNQSMELYNHCDSLSFAVYDHCWGKFSEGASGNDITLGYMCRGGSEGGSVQRHAGSSLLVLDLNGDAAMDLLLGDVGTTNLTSFINGGTSLDAEMISVNQSFPSGTESVNLDLFPSAYYLDVDNDGIKDLLVSPNAQNASENISSIWFYKNSGSSASPVFNLERKNFLQNTMIDVGEGAFPVIFDYNQDGLPDLLISNYGYYGSGGNYISRVALFKNIGSFSAPEFEHVTYDFANLSALNLTNLFPAFGDLDGDGDADMVIGESAGGILYFENTASAGSPANFVFRHSNFSAVNAGQFPAPVLFDLNKDGLLDLIIGSRSGNLTFVSNTGSATAAVFNAANAVRPFGGVDVRETGYVTGYSIPFIFSDSNDGSTKMLVGSEIGKLFFYENIDNNLSGNFTYAPEKFSNYRVGIRSAPAMADMDGDGKMDLFIGNYAGGVAFYKNDGTLSIDTKPVKRKEIKIFPVPASDLVNLELALDPIENTVISLYNIFGVEVLKKEFHMHQALQLDVSQLQEGLYTVIATAKGNQHFGKFIIRRN